MNRRAFLLTLVAGGGAFVHARPRRDSLTRYRSLIERAQRQASPEGRRVLAEGRRMVVQRLIVRGSCWNWLDTLYRRAGYPPSRRRTLFASRKRGPYADLALLRPGDWISHINHSYGNIEHSGMFVAWSDRKRRRALMLSYGGKGRNAAGRYRLYDLTHTYRIIRPAQGA